MKEWRYIRYADGSEELYNRDADPEEWINISRDPGYDVVKHDLIKLLPEINAEPSENEK